jgi:hypothetical protein
MLFILFVKPAPPKADRPKGGKKKMGFYGFAECPPEAGELGGVKKHRESCVFLFLVCRGRTQKIRVSFHRSINTRANMFLLRTSNPNTSYRFI